MNYWKSCCGIRFIDQVRNDVIKRIWVNIRFDGRHRKKKEVYYGTYTLEEQTQVGGLTASQNSRNVEKNLIQKICRKHSEKKYRITVLSCQIINLIRI